MTRFVQTSVLVILLLGAGAMYGAGAWRDAHVLVPDQAPWLAERLAALPLVVGEPPYRGVPDTLEDRIVDLSGADEYAAIDYRDEHGGYVRLHVGAAARTDAWFHEPTVCLPAHGWTTIQTRLVPLWPDLPGAEEGEQIWRLELQKGEDRMLVYYWFQFGEHIVTTRSERRWLRLQDRLAGRRDAPGQVVILYTPLGEDEAPSEARMEMLARSLWPDLFAILKVGD